MSRRRILIATIPWTNAIIIGALTYSAVSDPNPIMIGILAGFAAMMIYYSITEVEQKLAKPKWPAIYITRDQIEDQPDIVADYLRITQALRRYIEHQESVVGAQRRIADDLDNGVYDESLGNVDVDETPPQAYRMAARANRRVATYLRRTLNPEREKEA